MPAPAPLPAVNDAHARQAYKPLEQLINRPRFKGRVTDIMINGPRDVWLDLAGEGMVPVPANDVGFCTLAWFQRLCQVLAALERVSWNEDFPVVACKTPSGDRFQGQVGAQFTKGMFATIRVVRLLSADWDSFQITPEQRSKIEDALVRKQSVFISGGTGSGKTTFLRHLGTNVLPRDMRIMTIQDVDELTLPHKNLIGITVSRSTGATQVDWADAFDIGMRSRPDLIIPGELSIKSAFPMLQCFDSGHFGPPTTMHSNGPLEALRGFRRRVALGGGGAGAGETKDIMEFFAENVGVVVQIERVKGQDKRVVTAVERPIDLIDGRGAREEFVERERSFDGRIDYSLANAAVDLATGTMPPEEREQFGRWNRAFLMQLAMLGAFKPPVKGEDGGLAELSEDEKFWITGGVYRPRGVHDRREELKDIVAPAEGHFPKFDPLRDGVRQSEQEGQGA